jgi:hypothetical protein
MVELLQAKQISADQHPVQPTMVPPALLVQSPVAEQLLTAAEIRRCLIA